MMFLRRLMLRRQLRKEAKVESVYTIYAMNNEFGQTVYAPIFKVVKY